MSRLPNGYIELEYIESTGEQYIDTDLIGSENTKIVLDIEQDSISTNSMQSVGIITDVTRAISCNFRDNKSRFGVKIKSGAIVNDYDRHTVVIANNGYLVDDVNKWTPNADAFTTPDTMLLFNARGSSSNFIGKCYSGLFYENNVLVRNFIPAKRISDSAIGMYDTVSQSFFTNSGTGDFIAGPIAMKIEKFDSVIAINKARLPEQYQELEYIESSGTQYIDTGYKANTTKTTFKGSFTPKSVTPSCGLLGSRNSSVSAGVGSCNVFILDSSYFRLDWYNANGSTMTDFGNIVLNTKHDIEITRGKCTINGQTITNGLTSSEDQDYNFYIGNFNNAGTKYSSGFIGYIGQCTLLNEGVAVRNLIPAKRISDNVVGMYDIANSGKNLFDNYTAKLNPNTTYTISATLSAGTRKHIYTYSADGTQQRDLVSWSSATEGYQTVTFTTTANEVECKYTHVFDQVSELQIEQGSTATSYEPYPFYTNAGTGTFTAGSVVNPKELVRFNSVIAVQGKNLLNVNDRVSGEVSASSGNINTSAIYYTSNYIDISNLTDFTISVTTNITGGAGRNIAYYDSNKTFISGVTNAVTTINPASISKTFTKPNNAVYMRFCWLHDYQGTIINDYDIQLEQGSTATTYEPYRNELVRFNDIIVK